MSYTSGKQISWCWRHASGARSVRTYRRGTYCGRIRAVVGKQRRVEHEAAVLFEVKGRQKRRFPGGELESSAEQLEGSEPARSDLLEFARGFFLPKGYPDTVSEEYLQYQLRTLPAHVTGWLSKSLATSSLIHALGFGAVGASGTAAASAAIKWITKDGLGAFGRFLVGGRLGGVFDEDPRRWRMIAVGFATAGLALEIATTAYPGYFIALASAGNFTKAVGKGLSQPCFRIIQNHFALDNNVGDISAKEEVWEVVAQLLGLGSSVMLLRAIEAGGKPEAVLWVWGVVQVVHVALRYYSLDTLRFAELNQKRASLLVTAHVAGRAVPGVRQANAEEPMLAGPSSLQPRVRVGADVERAFGGASPSSAEIGDFEATYLAERYWLIWRGGAGCALLKHGFGRTDMLRMLWQAAWLDAKGICDATTHDYERSLTELERGFSDFEQQLRRLGWDVERSVFRLGDARIQAHAKGNG